MSDPGNLRNIDQLQEDDDQRRMPRGVTMALVVLGGGCVVFAGLALGGRTSQTPASKTDPLGELVSQRSHVVPTSTSSARPATDLSPKDVADVVLYLAGAAPATLTGAAIDVFG